jgi:hypothetical protein
VTGEVELAKCSFDFEFPVTSEELIGRIEEAILRAGGEFSGDVVEGVYSVPTPIGPITGTYSVSGQSIRIDVLDKPIILSCSLIGKKLSEYVRTAQSRYS